MTVSVQYFKKVLITVSVRYFKNHTRVLGVHLPYRLRARWRVKQRARVALCVKGDTTSGVIFVAT